jgi:hypothetical protein
MNLEFGRWYVDHENWATAEKYLRNARSIQGRPTFVEEAAELTRTVDAELNRERGRRSRRI